MNSGSAQQPSTGQPAVDRHHHAYDGRAQVRVVTLRRDDDQGLGFTMAEGQYGDKSVVVVTGIIPGGPAEEVGFVQLVISYMYLHTCTVCGSSEVPMLGSIHVSVCTHVRVPVSPLREILVGYKWS